MEKKDVINACKECLENIDKIIWWTQTIQNPIYDLDEEGHRIPRSLYDIRDGFVKYLKEYK